MNPKRLFSPGWVEAPLRKGMSHQCQVAGAVLTLRRCVHFTLFSPFLVPCKLELCYRDAHTSLKTSRPHWPGTQAFLSGHLPTSCLWALMVHHTPPSCCVFTSVLGQGPARMRYGKEQAPGARARLVWLYVSHVTHSKLAPSLSLSHPHP